MRGAAAQLLPGQPQDTPTAHATCDTGWAQVVGGRGNLSPPHSVSLLSFVLTPDARTHGSRTHGSRTGRERGSELDVSHTSTGNVMLKLQGDDRQQADSCLIYKRSLHLFCKPAAIFVDAVLTRHATHYLWSFTILKRDDAEFHTEQLN